MSKVMGLVSFQPTGSKVRKDKTSDKPYKVVKACKTGVETRKLRDKARVDNKVKTMKANVREYSRLIKKADKAQKSGFISLAEKFREMAVQFV